MIDIKNLAGGVLFSAAVSTLKDALIAAVKAGADLYGANLCGANLRAASLRGANLHGANLYGANLCGANLRAADLRGANLHGANLHGANLHGADLYGANLRAASLYGANLHGANLHGANLRGADLYGANLCGANLRAASLRGANLYGANLRGADLYGANLCGADLRAASLRGAKNSELAVAQIQHIPEEGAFVGFKKCKNNIIVKLQIPADAKRSHGTERKCRASKVKVLEVFGADIGISMHDSKTEYRKGKIVLPDGWNEDRWETCGQGIHFYITRAEAEAHS